VGAPQESRRETHERERLPVEGMLQTRLRLSMEIGDHGNEHQAEGSKKSLN